MKTLLKSLKIDEKLTKPVYNQFKNNIPRIEDYNFMADLIEMPETKNKNKYTLVIVDLATNEFDIEPLKNKSAEDVLEASKKILKDLICKFLMHLLELIMERNLKGYFKHFAT
jgi:hypothetical protein